MDGKLVCQYNDSEQAVHKTFDLWNSSPRKTKLTAKEFHQWLIQYTPHTFYYELEQAMKRFKDETE
jgi:hypothetical protein